MNYPIYIIMWDFGVLLLIIVVLLGIVRPSKRIQKKLIIFDLDDTLTTNLQLFPQTKSMLQILKRKGYDLSVASFNNYAREICQELDIAQYFDSIQGFQHNDKELHITLILNHYKDEGINYKARDILFVDNLKSNTDFVESRLGIKSVLVNAQGAILSDILTT
jgi:magnesium-dependent phosphatase-1